MKGALLSAVLGLGLMSTASADCEKYVQYRGHEGGVLYDGHWGRVSAEVVSKEEDRVQLRVRSKFGDGQKEDGLQELVLGEETRWEHHKGLPLFLENINPVEICVGSITSGEELTPDRIREIFRIYISDVNKALSRAEGEIRKEGEDYILIPAEDKPSDGLSTECRMIFGRDMFDVRYDSPRDWIRARNVDGRLIVQYRRSPPIGTFIRSKMIVLPEAPIVNEFYERAEELYDLRSRLPTLRASR